MSKPLDGRRILVLEDEFLAAMELQYQIESLGGEVVGPANGLAQAERLVDGHAPDLALLDVRLDHQTSYGFARRLRDRGVPVVFATGYAAETLPEDLRRLPRLAKPVSPRLFEQTLRQALKI